MGVNAIVPGIIFTGVFLVLLVAGLPVVFCLFSLAFFGLIVFTGWQGAATIMHLSVINTSDFSLLVVIPLFIFMTALLEKAIIARDVYNGVLVWVEGLPGGRAVSTVIMGMLMGTLVSDSGAAVVMAGKMSLLPMLRYGYNKFLAAGAVLAAAGLAIIIPPSVFLIIYSTTAEVELGKLFLGGVGPGLLLGLLFITYILFICYLRPALAPVLPDTERPSLREKVVSLKLLIFPTFLVGAILAGIMFGVLAPSEAAAVGSAMAICWIVLTHRLTWNDFKDAVYMTLRLTCMIMWLVVGARFFLALYSFTGVSRLGDFITGSSFPGWEFLLLIQVILLFLGLFLDPFVIVLLVMPVIRPMLGKFGFDPVWFGELFAVNMMIGYLTPPVGVNILYLKGVSPEILTLRDLYAAALPFVFLHLAGLILIMVFPQIALWLPGLMSKVP